MKIGDVYVNKHEESVKRLILFFTDNTVFYRVIESFDHGDLGSEASWNMRRFLRDHTLKKPEPKLKKLVAWVSNASGLVNGIAAEDDNIFCNNDEYVKKEIIIKDGQLYIEE